MTQGVFYFVRYCINLWKLIYCCFSSHFKFVRYFQYKLTQIDLILFFKSFPICWGFQVSLDIIRFTGSDHFKLFLIETWILQQRSIHEFDSWMLKWLVHKCESICLNVYWKSLNNLKWLEKQQVNFISLLQKLKILPILSLFF